MLNLLDRRVKNHWHLTRVVVPCPNLFGEGDYEIPLVYSSVCLSTSISQQLLSRLASFWKCLLINKFSCQKCCNWCYQVISCPDLQFDWPRGFRPLSHEPLNGFSSYSNHSFLLGALKTVLHTSAFDVFTLSCNLIGWEVSKQYPMNYSMDSLHICTRASS